jgi:hypothetical protein
MKPRQTIQVSVEVITPDEAKAYFATRAPNQRPLSQEFVGRYADIMARNGWELTHQGIAFNAEGQLIDGQHRMAAVVKSQATIESMVFRYRAVGNSMLVVDSGKPRSVPDKIAVLNLAQQVSGINGSQGVVLRDFGALINMFALLCDGYKQRRGSLDGDMLESIATKEPAIMWAMGLHRPTWGTVGLSALAFCRRIDQQKTDELVTLIESNMPSTSRAVQYIRNGLTNNELRPTHGNGTWRVMVAIRWVAAICAFFDGVDVPPQQSGNTAELLRPYRARRESSH